MDPRRTERLSEALRFELDEILNYELDDPRMTSVAVTEVLLAADGKKAHVRLAIQGEALEQEECLKAIEKAKGYIRHLLVERIDMLRIPDLRFDCDLSPELRVKAEALLKRVRRGRPKEETNQARDSSSKKNL
jgi:ribosome-binding factor A